MAAVILALPVLLILAASGYPVYGAKRSIAVAVVVTVVTCVVSWVVVVLALASALSGTTAGTLLDIVVFGVPAVCVLVTGLLARRLIADRATADDSTSASPAPTQHRHR